MAAITAALIKQVREETGAGMMDVKMASAKVARLRKAPSPPRSWNPPMARPVTPSN